MSGSRPSERIGAVDFWRGICLLMIFVNHIPGNPLSLVTFRTWGFADAAEVFVFLAGFSATLAFTRYFRDGGFLCGALRVVRRTWQLFCAHVLLVFALSLVIAVGGLFTDSRPIMEQLNFSPFFVETEAAILHLVWLQYMPSMTDILPIYIVFVALFPVLWLMMRVSPWLALAASFGLWLWTNVTGHALPNYPEGMHWFFNPLAWQFLFVAGAVTARERARLAGVLRSDPLLGISLLFAVFGAVAAAPWTHLAAFAEIRVIPAEFLRLDDKSNLSALRLGHFFALAVLAARLLPETARFWRWPGVAAIRAVGRHALPVYCGGVVLSLAAHIFLVLRSAGTAEILLVDVAGIAALIGLAAGLEKAAAILKRVQPPREPVLS